MFKKSKIVASCLAVASLALGVFALNDGNVTVSANNQPSLYFEDGAAIRISEDGLSDGLRFTAIASEALVQEKMNVNEDKTCASYKTANETFGMIIVPASYMTDYAVNGGELDYYTYFNTIKGKMINFEFAAEHISYNTAKGAYIYAGAVANVNFNNMIMDYQSVVYYKAANGEYTYGEVSDTRSYGFVASAAYNRPKTAYDATIKAKFVPIVEKAMYVASGVTFDYETELYSYGDTTSENYEMVALNPTVEISGSVNTLKVGETTQLTATAVPFAGVDVVWSVAENAPVTVENGLVTAKSAGTAVITASYMDDYSDTYEITVAKEAVTLANTKDVETKVNNSLAFTGLIDGNVTAVALGGNALSGWSYDDATDTLSIPAASLTEAELGQNKWLTVETASTVYTQKVWVVNKVITTFGELKNTYKYADIAANNEIGGYFVLGKDIDCSAMTKDDYYTGGAGVGTGLSLHLGLADNPSDVTTTLIESYKFVGTFDGRGYCISDAMMAGYGMFGVIGEKGVVKNLMVKKANLLNGGYTNYVGVIAVYNYGTVEMVSMSIDGVGYEAYAFGVSHSNYGTIRKVFVRAWVYDTSVTTKWNFAAVARYSGSAPVYEKLGVASGYDTVDKAMIKNNGGVYSYKVGDIVSLWGGWDSARPGTPSEGYYSDENGAGRDLLSPVSSDESTKLNRWNA